MDRGVGERRGKLAKGQRERQRVSEGEREDRREGERKKR